MKSNQELIDAINKAANMINNAQRQGSANHIVVNARISEEFNNIMEEQKVKEQKKLRNKKLKTIIKDE